MDGERAKTIRDKICRQREKIQIDTRWRQSIVGNEGINRQDGEQIETESRYDDVVVTNEEERK